MPSSKNHLSNDYTEAYGEYRAALADLNDAKNNHIRAKGRYSDAIAGLQAAKSVGKYAPPTPDELQRRATRELIQRAQMDLQVQKIEGRERMRRWNEVLRIVNDWDQDQTIPEFNKLFQAYHAGDPQTLELIQRLKLEAPGDNTGLKQILLDRLNPDDHGESK